MSLNEKEVVKKLREELKGGRLTISDETSLNYVIERSLDHSYSVPEINRFCIIGAIMSPDQIANIPEKYSKFSIDELILDGYFDIEGGTEDKLFLFLRDLQQDYDYLVRNKRIKPEHKLERFTETFQHYLEVYNYD